MARSRWARRWPPCCSSTACIPSSPLPAAFLSGTVAGALTGVIHTRFDINGLLSGILVMTALYSINLHVMGRSNVPLLEVRTLATQAEHAGTWLFGSTADLRIWGWDVAMRDAAMLVLALAAAATVGAADLRVLSAPTSAPRCRRPATTRR